MYADCAKGVINSRPEDTKALKCIHVLTLSRRSILLKSLQFRKSPQIKTIFTRTLNLNIHTCIYTYHSRFIPEGVAEASQILFRDAHVLPRRMNIET
jgi:hypothetical protein